MHTRRVSTARQRCEKVLGRASYSAGTCIPAAYLDASAWSYEQGTSSSVVGSESLCRSRSLASVLCATSSTRNNARSGLTSVKVRRLAQLPVMLDCIAWWRDSLAEDLCPGNARATGHWRCGRVQWSNLLSSSAALRECPVLALRTPAVTYRKSLLLAPSLSSSFHRPPTTPSPTTRVLLLSRPPPDSR